LIRDCFQTYFVAIYFLDDSGERLVLAEATGDLGEELKSSGHSLSMSEDRLVSKAINHLNSQTLAGPALDYRIDRDLFPHTRAQLAIPLKIGDRGIGVLDVHSTLKDAFEGNEIMVLETLSGQIVVAIENARAYQMEHRAHEQLRELDELRRRFLSNMSRELRMPLNNIIGFSRVILKGIDGPINNVQRDDLTAIHDSGQHLLALINDILDIAQIEAGAMELSIQQADFGEIARSVIPTSNALLEGRPVRFTYDISPDLPAVMADPLRLRQVLVKLLSNAAKFTPEGEIALAVWCDDGEIITTVTDTGIGIPEKDREKVFELFRQGSRAGSSGDNSGTGLGLTFSKEIVEMHGGTIWLDSQEGQGTAFTIILPAVEPEKVAE
jgi:signal transduction histidine kinase